MTFVVITFGLLGAVANVQRMNDAQQAPTATSEFVAGKIFQLYNVGAGMYYCAGNSYGTQASVGESPMYVRLNQYGNLEDTYVLFNLFDGYWQQSFFDSDVAMFVDRRNQVNFGWNIVKVGDYYRLQATANINVNPDYNTTAYPNTYVGLDVSENAENTALSPFLAEGDGHYIDWMLVEIPSSGSWTSTNHAPSSTSDYLWEFDLKAASQLFFNWSVSSEGSCDILYVTLDDNLIIEASGEQSDSFTALLDSGYHTLYARYRKDGSVDSGADEAKITGVYAGTADEFLATYIQRVKDAADANNKKDPSVYEEAMAYIAQIESGAIPHATIDELNAIIARLESYQTLLGYTWLAINVEEAGSLGDLILAQVSDFKDVQSIKITGKLNSDDIYVIKNLLLQAAIIDIEGTNITEITNEMFRNRSTLQRIKLPSGLTSIGEYAFYGCTALTDVTLPEGLTSMGYGAFQNTRLTSITFPSTLKAIANAAFYNCRSLASITFNQQEEIGDQAFQACYALTEVTLSTTMKKLQSNAFFECTALDSLTLNEGLEYIGNNAFYNCYNLTKVSLPSTLSFIGENAFYNCNTITEMTCLAIAPPYNNERNIINREGIKLYVPELSLNVYKQRAGWTQFDIEGINYLPENIVITESYKLSWPDDVAQTYKPNITIGSLNTQGYTPESRWDFYRYNRYGSVTVTGNATMSANLFTMVYDPYTEWYYKWNEGSDQRKVCNASLLNNNNVRADNIDIKLMTRADYWDFLVFPFDVKISEIESDVLGGAFVIRKYDGQKRGEGLMDQTWVNMTNDSTLKAGVGYIWQSANTGKDYNNFTIHALQTTNKNNIFAKDDVKVPVNYYAAEFDHNRSWNLIGNPYPAYYDTRFMQFQAPVTVWNSYNRNYEAYSTLDDAYILSPGQAFFVQAPADASSITFSADGRQTNLDVREIEAARAASNVQRSVLNIVISGNEMTDRTRVVINANAQLGYEQDKDASKFFSLNAEAVQLYSLQQGVSFSINERPLADGTISLGAKFGQDGMYTITLDTRADCQTVLVDHLTGTETLLNGTEGYTFYAEKGTANQRFTLRISGAGVTGIETVEGINANGQENYFDLQGRRIAEPQKGLYIHNGKKVTVK